jgi:DNA (cytosine-5)-methyltransferase 1
VGRLGVLIDRQMVKDHQVVRFIDLFCGIGGFRLGLERANQQNTNSQERQEKVRDTGNEYLHTRRDNGRDRQPPPEFHCVWSCDIDKYAGQIYAKQFGEEPAGDITKIPAESIPDHDLLCAGFPCQSFSIAGKRKGFEDTRGTLFFEICRILRAKRPSYCLLENVKGLLSHDGGKTFQTILESLDELGYDCQWQILNSKNFGVPQNRERVFIIGHLRGKPRPEIFPIANQPQEIYEKRNGQNIAGTIETKNQSGQAQWDGSTTLISAAIDANYGKGFDNHDQSPLIVSNPHGFNKGGIKNLPCLRKSSLDRNEFVVLGYTRKFDENRKVVRRNHVNKIFNQVKQRCGNQENYLTNYSQIRRLTPLECERLQGFPDGWTEGISDTQRYKCLGNAVTVNLIEYLGQSLIGALGHRELGG